MRELLFCWFSTRMEVLVPKRRGAGFLKVPLGHHHDPALARVEDAARCDVSGLDGSLTFECGGRIGCYAETRNTFQRLVLPLLEKHYGCPAREVTQAEFWALHPRMNGR